MKKLNLWKLLFSALTVLAATTFSACVDDNEDNGMPFLSVTPETLSFTLDGVAEGSSAFEVQTNRPWKLTPQDGSEWVTIEKTEGNGSTTVEISVPGSLEGRVATLDFQLSNTYGAYMTKTVYVKQGDVQIPGVLPTQVVTEFGDDFTAVENGQVYESPYWTFTSSDTGYPANPKLGWFGTIYSDGSHYLQCAPYNSKLATVTCYAIMTPFNVKEATDKTLNFKLAWYANTATSSIDDTKIEVVASTTVTDETVTDDGVWTVVKTIQYTDGEDAMNNYFPQTADLSAYANDEKVYVAFRYVGHNNTYRLDDVSFNGGKPSTLVIEPETLSLGATEGATATVKVTATDPWEANVASGSGFTIENGSGSGDGQFTVKASAGNDTADEKELGTISVTSVVGTKTVTVKQKGQSNDIYYESFGAPVQNASKQWPYANDNPTNVKQGYGFVDGTTTYKGYSTTARTVPNSDSPNPPCSAEGHCWFPTGKTYATNYFEVEKLVMPNETNISFEFVLRGSSGPYKDGDLKFEISADGETWKELTFSLGTIPGLPVGGDAKDWQMASKAVTLKTAVEYLYVRWSSETTGGVRMDDPRIFVGTGGEEIDFGSPDTPGVTTSDATNVQSTTATIGGALKNAQAADYTEVGVYYIEKPAAGEVDWSKATKKAAAAVATPWTVELTGLTANTAYLYHAYATPKTGEELVGADKELKTTPAEITVAGDVVVAFSGADVATPALPTSATNGTATYTIGGLNYTISSPSYYFRDYASASYGMWPYTTLYVKGGDPAGYIDLPAVEGKKLTKIELASAGNMGGSVELSVQDAQGNAVAGGESRKFEQTSLTNPALTTFVLTGTEANTSYRLNVDKSNAQFHKIGLTYEGATGPVQLKLNPETATMEIGATADATGTQTYTITGDAAGLQLFAEVADKTNFSAAVSDKTVTVKTLTANAGTTDRTTTVTVYLAASADADKKATATINVTQKAPVSDTPLTVAELVALYKAGTDVKDRTVTGIVAAFTPAGNYDTNLSGGVLVLTDNDGAEYSGITFVTSIGNAAVAVGDKIEIKLTNAAMKTNKGLRQYEGVLADDVTKVSSGTVVSYKDLTGAQVAADYEKYMSVPVQVENASPATTSVGKQFNKSLTFTQGGTDFTVYGRSGWNAGAGAVVGDATGTIRGILSVYNSPQLLPITLDDVRPFISTLPTIIDVAPDKLTWTAEAVDAKELAVSVVNLNGLTLSSLTHFDATVSNTTVTVTPKGANTSAEDFVETLTITATGGNSMDVLLTQKKPVSGNSLVLTADLTSLGNFPAGFPVNSTTGFVGLKEIEFNGYTYTVNAPDKGYAISGTGGKYAIFYGKTGAYIEFPAIEGYKLVKVEITEGIGCGKGIKVNMVNAEGATVSTESTTVGGSSETVHTFDITSPAINTAYRFLTVTSGKNMQVGGWTLTYEK